MKRLLFILISWSIFIVGCSNPTKPAETGSAEGLTPNEAQSSMGQATSEVAVSKVEQPKVEEPTVVPPREDVVQAVSPPAANQINPIQQEPQAISSVPAENAPAPIEQSANAAADQAITQEIQQLILKDESLAADADRIKIVVIDGHVTLKGTVEDEKTRNDIEVKTKVIEGVRQVDNQLEVKTKNQV